MTLPILAIELEKFDELQGQTFNVGGGNACSLSLLETTLLCLRITGNVVTVHSEISTQPADMPIYITDNSRITAVTGWRPKITPEQALHSIHEWIMTEMSMVRHVWA